MTLAEAKEYRRSSDPRVRAAAERVIAAAKARRKRTAPKRKDREDAEAAEARRLLARRRRVYREVDARSQGRCEETNGVTECCNDATEHDHFWGRGKEKETTETVWHLCKFHHDSKTAWDPGRAEWIRRFKLHAARHRYREQEAKCDREIALETAQHPRKGTDR